MQIRTLHRYVAAAALMLLVSGVALATDPIRLPSIGGLDGIGRTSVKVQVAAQFTEPSGDQPARLFVTAQAADGYHIYSITQPPGGPRKTLVVLDEASGYRLAGEFQAIDSPKIDNSQTTWPGLPIEEHYGTVTWYAPIELAGGVNLQTLTISGVLDTQACDAKSCEPLKLRFAARPGPGVAIPVAAPEAETKLQSLPYTLLFAFLGGLLLNLMPCVLPVIGLKILAFAEQGGQSRGRVFALNFWYSVGLISVFLVLASLAAYLNMGWGEQFTLTWFKVAMIGLVFVMALSFLGVWEIPIPGFIGSGKATEIAAQEGMAGAFSKGIFTTILATPCSGPFLGPVFGYTLGQPAAVTYLIFAMVGFGMAAPYLILGIFPQWVRFLPKPGAWMDTFKQLMGFLLLATVVYLFSTIKSVYFIPTLALMVGLWFACWLIGRTPATADADKKLTAWLTGGVVAAAVGGLAFFYLGPNPYALPWKPYSPVALAEAQAQGKTVLLDFTADWCPTCKVNSKIALNTRAVQQLVEQNKVVPLLADWTDRSPEIKETLNKFGHNSIPLLVIFPAGRPHEHVTIPDLVTKTQVLDALKRAGPSQATAAAAPSRVSVR